ncbi:MAG TPA: carboxypeptidase regulatory-like domain-containing protein, partial [Acidobacteriota bacterium]
MIRKTILLFVLIAGTVCGAALAQSVEGRISGTVTDPNDAVVPGVEVIVENEETGVRRQTVSDDQGRYAMPLLQPGRYRVTATLPGFRTYQRTGIIIATSESIVLDFKLELGEVQDTITVSGAAPLLEAGTSDIGQLIEPKTVSDMPLNGRRALNLAQLAGATVWVNYSGNAKPNFSLAGGRTQSQNFSIDGGTGQNMRLGVGQIDTDPPVEAVREFKILASSYSAEYGGSAGGLVIMTTKSGTNDFHGSLFEYFRNDALDAAGFFSPIDARTGEKDKPPLRYNLFGGTIGGPILKNRTHFFGAYEVTRQRVGATQVMTVPTELQRRGDFSQTLNAAGRVIQIYDPSTTRTVSGRAVRDLFSGNRIPANQLDPVALKLLNFWPVPNREASNPAGANNFAANWTELFDRDNVTARVDHVINQRWNLYGRYMYNKDPITQTSVLPDPRADAATIRDRFQHNILVATTYAFRPSIINDLRFTFTTRQNHAKSMGLGGTWDRDLGLKGISGEAFPRINVTGITSIGSAAQERRQFPIRQYHTGDSLTWFHGKHFLKMGGEVRKSTNFEVNRPSISGVFAFGVQPTGLPGTSGTGLGLASFLVGFPNSFNVRETEALDRYSWYLAGFVQDDWKVHPNLTLNIGLRWEVDTPMTDRNQRMNGFDATAINPVSKTPGVVRFSGVDGWPDSSAEPDWNNFGPRVGFAWRPFGSKKTVIRGGGGVFFAHPFDHGAPASAALGFERSANLQTPDNGITAPFLLKDGVPPVQLTGAALTPGFGAVEVGRAATTAVTFYERSRRSGYSQQFNLGVQHEIRG